MCWRYFISLNNILNFDLFLNNLLSTYILFISLNSFVCSFKEIIFMICYVSFAIWQCWFLDFCYMMPLIKLFCSSWVYFYFEFPFAFWNRWRVILDSDVHWCLWCLMTLVHGDVLLCLCYAKKLFLKFIMFLLVITMYF